MADARTLHFFEGWPPERHSLDCPACEIDRLREALEWAIKWRPPRAGIDSFERHLREALTSGPGGGKDG